MRNWFAVLVALALGVCVLAVGCSPSGNAAGDPETITKVQNAVSASGYGEQLRGMTAEGDGKVTITLTSTGTEFKDKIMPDVVANRVLDTVPGITQVTLLWDTGAQIDVYNAK